MSTWRLAKSLAELLLEVNTYAPDRSKALDGTIGDAAHAARASRHNPNAYGVVTALDITHDPSHGMDAHTLARLLTRNPHPELTYIISDGETASRAGGWKWRTYSGSHPHDQHIHVAVGAGTDSNPQPPYDDAASWHVRELLQGDTDMDEATVRKIVREEVDKIYSPDVEAAQKHLVSIGLLSAVRPADRPASWGLVALMVSRACKFIGGKAS